MRTAEDHKNFVSDLKKDLGIDFDDVFKKLADALNSNPDNYAKCTVPFEKFENKKPQRYL